MGEVRPIPRLGGVVPDVRGAGRALRVSWHSEDGLVVLSLWDGPRCTGTVRVAAADVPTLVEALQLGLATMPPAADAPVTDAPFAPARPGEPPVDGLGGTAGAPAGGADVLEGPGGAATG